MTFAKFNKSASCEIATPAAKLGDLALAFAENRLRENSKHYFATPQSHFADAQSGRFAGEDRAEAHRRHRPHFHRDHSSTFRNTNHSRMNVANGKQAISRFGFILADEHAADGEKVPIEFQPAHERAV